MVDIKKLVHDAWLAGHNYALAQTLDPPDSIVCTEHREAIKAGEAARTAIRYLENLETEYYFLTHREYDDNAARAFANRRDLARTVAQVWLRLDEAETQAMVDAAAEHGGTGGALLNWYLARLRAENAELRARHDPPLVDADRG